MLIWPISKIFLIITYYKYLRDFLLFVALLFGLNMDFDHFEFTYTAITGILWSLWFKFLDNILLWLHTLLNWIIRYRMNQDTLITLEDLPEMENMETVIIDIRPRKR